MTLTDEQLEQAARELCLEDKINPNEYHDWNANWSTVADEIKRWLQIQEAVNRVVGKQDLGRYLADLKRAGEAISRTAEGLKPV